MSWCGAHWRWRGHLCSWPGHSHSRPWHITASPKQIQQVVILVKTYWWKWWGRELASQTIWQSFLKCFLNISANSQDAPSGPCHLSFLSPQLSPQGQPFIFLPSCPPILAEALSLLQITPRFLFILSFTQSIVTPSQPLISSSIPMAPLSKLSSFSGPTHLRRDGSGRQLSLA